MMRAYLVDDEPLAVKRLARMLLATGRVVITGSANDPQTALEFLRAQPVDVLFLDIQMPGLTGFELLDRLEAQPMVIFTTAYDRYAVSAFELEALDYLLKPFGRERCLAALERARRMIPVNERGGPGEASSAPPLVERARSVMADSGPLTRLFVRDRERIVPVAAAEIERLEAADDYVEVRTKSRSYLVYLTLNDFERRLDPERFIRVHRAHIVNLDFVKQLVPFDGSRMQVEMRDGTKILASRARSKELRQLAV
jgi:two-component system, LytTR family, response regulator